MRCGGEENVLDLKGLVAWFTGAILWMGLSPDGILEREEFSEAERRLGVDWLRPGGRKAGQIKKIVVRHCICGVSYE